MGKLTKKELEIARKAFKAMKVTKAVDLGGFIEIHINSKIPVNVIINTDEQDLSRCNSESKGKRKTYFFD